MVRTAKNIIRRLYEIFFGWFVQQKIQEEKIKTLQIVYRNTWAAWRAIWRVTYPQIAPIPPVEPESYEAYLAKLQALEPNAYPAWYKLLSANETAYRAAPLESCSIGGHYAGEAFASFIAPYLKNRVLDIGCGPQAIPVYLDGYPTPLISGIDPLLPFEPHPFQFVHGFAEYMPWLDGTFDAVLVATSLDHVLSLEKALAEFSRVLSPDGVLLIWVAFLPGYPPYNPRQPNIQPIDDFHLFHFDKDWFEELLARSFILVEQFTADFQSHFYCYKKKPQA